ncbi:hypothetical protein J5837_07670, partial [Pseudoxanthomonas helianthi]
MLSIFKKKPAPTLNGLFLLNMHIGRGSNSEMPANLAGAYVGVFIGAPDPNGALVQAVTELRRRGYEFIDLSDGKIHQLDPMQWDTYVQNAWPEFPNHFPRRTEVIAGLSSPSWVFFGPFAGYEPQRA